MANKINLLELSDQELISKIKEDSRYLSVVREKYKFSCLKLLSKYSKKLKHITTEDVFSESCFQLYKNIKQKNLELTNNSSLKTYLNSICLRQLLKELNGEIDNKGFKSQNRKIIINEDVFSANELIELEDRLKIRSSNYKIINSEWLPDDITNNEEYSNNHELNVMKNALDKIKDSGGHCYELLKLFFWEKKSMKELTKIFDYTNEVNTRNQKAKCQKRLKTIMLKEL